MEARISTQESQIIECEGALKSRNEEIKSLKYERDDLAERCDETEKSILLARDTIEELKESLAVTKVRFLRKINLLFLIYFTSFIMPFQIFIISLFLTFFLL